MRIVSLIASSLLFVISGTLLAQDAPAPTKEPPPDPPLLGSAPADCQWTITYTPKVPPKDPPSPEDLRNRKMRLRYSPITLSKHVLKSAGQIVVYTNYEADIKTEAWVVAGYYYELPHREGESIHINTRPAGDFPEVYWITADNFRGTVEVKGAKVYLYETDATDTRPDPALSSRPSAVPSSTPVKILPRRAYIDVKTRLPTTVDIGDTVLTYQYSGPADTFPTPDDRIKKIMRDSVIQKKH